MFKISKNPQITVPVPLIVNGEDSSFSATFDILPSDRIRPEAMSTDEGQAQLLLDAIVDLGDLVDDAGAPLPFSREVAAAVINRFDARSALLTAYMKGVTEIMRGNSAGLPAPGATAA